MMWLRPTLRSLVVPMPGENCLMWEAVHAYKIKDVIEIMRRLVGGNTTVEVGALPIPEGGRQRDFL